MDTEERWLRVEEFAANPKIQTSPGTVRRWCREGIIQSRRAGRSFLIPASELDRSIVLPDPSTAPTPPKLPAVQTLTVEGGAKEIAEIEELAKRLGVRVTRG